MEKSIEFNPTSIYTKLAAIQKILKAPKNQFNKFGGYNFRNLEDILEALKPLLAEHGLAILIKDSVQLVHERYYIQATVTLFDTNSGQSIETTALAREPESKKGMDESQLTGATSSYARKYAMNGLFAIDDTKDADSTNDHGKQQAQQPSKPVPTKAAKEVAEKIKEAKEKGLVSAELDKEMLSLWHSGKFDLFVERYKAFEASLDA